ncbi:autotransporter family protein [Pandoraea communis]|uniref:autotransporter family protein n=3 Tax=Pandoraea communis TaxID=2508297 RepID=UPI0025A5750E|nr:autotransporter domain-containing protein [Pandoraea communis]MDM8356000.1 autotransporter domain-containing protein [Pandoraea communis]
MQSKFQTSKTLRQSKICLAVATMLAAMSMPAQAEDVIESETATWSDEKKNVAKRMNARLVEVQGEREEKDNIFDRLDALKTVRSNIHSGTKNIGDAVAYGNKLAEITGQIENLIAELEKDGGKALNFDWERKLQVTDLADVKQQIQKVIDADPDDFANAREQLDIFLNDNADHSKSSDAAMGVYAKVAALKARIDALDKADEATFKVMANTRELVASSQNGADAALTWRDDNLFNSHFDESYAEGNVQIGAQTLLEITQRSGTGSNPITGLTDSTRNVGTLRVSAGADHSLDVRQGQLNIHQGIEGKGTLGITVGSNGTLTFKEGGQGIDRDADGVTLSVGRDGNANASMLDAGGIVKFESGTSAGGAWIWAFDEGEVSFAEGADAGVSEISILKGGTVRFEGANVKQSSIVSSGILDIARSSGGDAEVFNEVDGDLRVNASALERMRLSNGGFAELRASSGGAAKIENTTSGLIVFDDGALENLTLRNEGAAIVTGASGGNAIIDNRASGKVVFHDTALENVQLSNHGLIGLVGETTADKAVVRMNGGTLDVSFVGDTVEVTSPNEETTMARTVTFVPGVKKSIEIGSLSGTGDVITGETALTVGAANLDGEFGGSFVKTGAGIGSLVDEWLTAVNQESESLALRAPAAPQVGAGPMLLTKVGTGNLTLSGDQSQVDVISVQGGTLTAAHEKALGSGALSVAQSAAVVLNKDVSGVKAMNNAGTINLGTNKLSVESYQSEAGAEINSRVEKIDGQATGGTIQVEQESDFSNTEIKVAVADDIELSDVVGKFQVVEAADGVEVIGGKLKVGSITGGKQADPNVGPEPIGEPGTGTKITDKNIVKFLAADGGYTANEQAVLASVDGVTVGDLASGKIGGKVLSAMALQTAGTEEQRRSARMLSGESLVNNAVAAQAAATSFQRGMQTRMIAGGAMFDDKTANGAMVSDNGVAGWASFNGGKTSQRGDGMSFDVKGLDGAIGVDKRLNQNTLVGGSIGFGNQESKAKGLPGESKVNSVSVGLYGSHLTGSNWFVNGGASYTNHSVKTDRTVAARNASARLAGKTSGQTFGMFGEVGKRFEVSGVNIDPSVGVRVASTRLKAFDETNRDGSGNDGLKVGSQSQTSTRGVLGVRLWSEVASIAGGKVAPSLRLSYEHEFGKTQSSLTNAIYGAPGSFTVKGPKLGKDIFTADLGLDMQLKKQLEVRVGGNVSVRKGESALGGGISAKYRF